MRRSVTLIHAGKIAAVLVAAALTLQFFSLLSNAAGTVLLSLSTQTPTINQGDIIGIAVSSDTFDGITQFEDVRIAFDEDRFEFVSVTAEEILSGYDFEVADSGGNVFISAAFRDGVDDETGNPLQPYSSGEQTVIFRLALRARPDSAGSTSVSIVSAGSFYKSGGEQVESYSAAALPVDIAMGVSTDATLSQLSIEGVTITPPFNSQIYEYSATVGRDVESVNVNATANNLQAVISVEGADDIENGENIVSVRVLAQDGIRWKEYRIFVNRQENYIPEGSGFIDSEGVKFTFLSFPSNMTLPEGFYQTTKTINGYSVPVFAKEGIVSVLVYIYNGNDNPSLCFYNPQNSITTPYVPGNTVISTGRVLTASPVPEGTEVPAGFSEGTYEINGAGMQGFVNKDGNFLAYFSDDSGNSDFYLYDPSSGLFNEYRSVDRSSERVYRNLFYIFLLTSVVQSIIIIVTGFVISRVITNRSNPRPKRV